MPKRIFFPILAISAFFVQGLSDTAFAVTYRCIGRSSNAEYNRSLCEAECEALGQRLRNMGCGVGANSFCQKIKKFKSMDTCRCWCVPK